jgi:hypothetical protein
MRGAKTVRILAVPLVLAVALISSACSKGGGAGTNSPTPYDRPSSPAKVTILAPTNGEVVHGSIVPVRVRLVGARIVRPTTTHIVPTQGHLHVFLDNQIVSMNFSLSGRIGAVKPGLHVLRVEFVASDHLPFDPRVFTAVTFQVQR